MYRRTTRRLLFTMLFAGTLTACADQPTAPPASPPLEPNAAFLRNLPRPTVMSRNLYLGANLDPVLAIQDPNQVPVVIAQTWAAIVASNFPERAESLAREIELHQPTLIGLQEATVYKRQSPSDIVLGNRAPNAQVVAYDFVELLLSALARRGLNYQVAAKVLNNDFEFPMYTGVGPLPFDDVRYMDHDVILVRSGLQFSNPVARNFAAHVPLSVGGAPIAIRRGWTAVDVTGFGQTVRFVNTHLEVQGFRPVQEAQARELVAWANESPHPVVMLGDFNSAANPSAPEESKTGSYDIIVAGGFADLWKRTNPFREGATCCHAADLRNAEPSFLQRIDMIFVKPDLGPLFRAFDMTIVGDEQGNRTPSGLWPSDHGGVVAGFLLPRN